ncbi:hypothetical protein FGG08_006231 [Glutinoglossum americanum]|uniref:Uncharacterized protein n=1 Tax=Glutinoglossum americanum TaxID=1670608 RepID=A0A9P8L250_9PEZI|nr:hypothetical protein FGG08_006231 [Glutinoglossum americanum]
MDPATALHLYATELIYSEKAKASNYRQATIRSSLGLEPRQFELLKIAARQMVEAEVGSPLQQKNLSHRKRMSENQVYLVNKVSELVDSLPDREAIRSATSPKDLFLGVLRLLVTTSKHYTEKIPYNTRKRKNRSWQESGEDGEGDQGGTAVAERARRVVMPRKLRRSARFSAPGSSGGASKSLVDLYEPARKSSSETPNIPARREPASSKSVEVSSIGRTRGSAKEALGSMATGVSKSQVPLSAAPQTAEQTTLPRRRSMRLSRNLSSLTHQCTQQRHPPNSPLPPITPTPIYRRYPHRSTGNYTEPQNRHFHQTRSRGNPGPPPTSGKTKSEVELRKINALLMEEKFRAEHLEAGGREDKSLLASRAAKIKDLESALALSTAKIRDLETKRHQDRCTSADKIKTLESELREAKSLIASRAAKIKDLESALALSANKVKSLESLLLAANKAKADMRSSGKRRRLNGGSNNNNSNNNGPQQTLSLAWSDQYIQNFKELRRGVSKDFYGVSPTPSVMGEGAK